MISLPDDMLIHIFYILNKNDLYSYISLSKRFNTLFNQYQLARLMLTNKIHNYNPLNKCVNANCYRVTKDIFYNVYMRHNTLYRHSHQCAINKKTIIHKGMIYEVTTPYCYICLLTYILD